MRDCRRAGWNCCAAAAAGFPGAAAFDPAILRPAAVNAIPGETPLHRYYHAAGAALTGLVAMSRKLSGLLRRTPRSLLVCCGIGPVSFKGRWPANLRSPFRISGFLDMPHELWFRPFSLFIAAGCPLRVIGSGFEFTEGPVWHPRQRALVFFRYSGQTRYRFDGKAVRAACPFPPARGTA